MPSLGVYFTEENAALVERVVKERGEEKVSPYIAEAVRQRLEREGYLPGTEAHARKEKLRVLGESLSDADLDALVAKQFAAKATHQAA